MADEDEIDIEGDFEFKFGSSESLSSGVYDSELPSHSVNLLPEFTQPSWMLDQAWCLDHLDDKSKVTVEKMLLEEQHYVNGKTSSMITTSGSSCTQPTKKPTTRQPWTEQEKDLFVKGLDIFGRSWLKISELLPNRTHIQVKNYAQQYFKSKAKEENKIESLSKSPETEALESGSLLAEVLASVSTAKPTINVKTHKKPSMKPSNAFSKTKTPKKSPTKGLKKGHIVVPTNKPNLGIHTNLNSSEVIVMKKKGDDALSSDEDVDIDVEDDLDPSSAPVLTEADSVYEKLLASANKEEISSTDEGKPPTKLSDDVEKRGDSNDEVNFNMVDGRTDIKHEYDKLCDSHDVINNQPNSPLSYSENNEPFKESMNSEICKADKPALILENQFSADSVGKKPISNQNIDDKMADSVGVGSSSDICGPLVDRMEDEDWEDSQDGDLHENETAVLTSSGEVMYLTNPTQEVQIDKDTITDTEKTIHSEFFEGRSTKTPERYLKIRNYIIDSWMKVKPSYLNKTGLRSGLKNCGDVNCIGRIHAYLEQMGCINFGCENCAYNRPNRSRFIVYTREKPSSDERRSQIMDRMESMRPRKRRVRDIFGEWVDEKDLEGKTINHTEALHTATAAKVSRIKNTYDPFKLIPCAEFSPLNPAPFQLEMSALSMAIMDIHSHLSKTEVIGLLGGRFIKEQGKLVVMMAEPCHSLSTGMQCEMDPVSQSESSEKIQALGYRVLGWYHSHPTFIPNPSVRDIETQEKYQSWLCRDGCPFIGSIVSPYNRQNPSLHSQVKCLVAISENKTNACSSAPYEFDASVVATGVDRDATLTQLKALAEKYIKEPNHVNLLNYYKQMNNITCLEKMLQSVGRYLELEGETGSLLLEDLKNLYSSIFGCQESS